MSHAGVSEGPSDTALRARTAGVAMRVQRLPYVWPSEPTAAAARQHGHGTCASKHALLAEELDAAGLVSVPLLVVGPLVPPVLAQHDDFADDTDLLEVHECLCVLTPWAGPLRVDVTFDPPLLARGLPGTANWDGRTDMELATGNSCPGWAVPSRSVREHKERLRARLYQQSSRQRQRRDAALQRLSDQYEQWRQGN